MVFTYGENKLVTIIQKEEPWFKGADVCNVLGINHSRDVIRRRLEDDEKVRLKVASGQTTWFVNESGLYALIMRSNKPQAKAFRKWVTSEVLPAIRKNGYFASTNTAATYIQQAIAVCGSNRKLASRIGVAPGSLSTLQTRPHMFNSAFIARVIQACSKIIEQNGAIDTSSLEMLMQVEDKDIRLGLYNKMKKGGLL